MKTLLLSLDPAMINSAGAAMLLKPGGLRRLTLWESDGIEEAGEVAELWQSLIVEHEPDRIVLAVEYPCWNAGAAQAVRAAANVYIKLAKKLRPKVEVVKVDPNKWQRTWDYRGRAKGAETKELSLKLAPLYGWDPRGNHNKADAVLILEWLKANLQPLAPPKKKSSKGTRQSDNGKVSSKRLKSQARSKPVHERTNDDADSGE